MVKKDNDDFFNDDFLFARAILFYLPTELKKTVNIQSSIGEKEEVDRKNLVFRGVRRWDDDEFE